MKYTCQHCGYDIEADTEFEGIASTCPKCNRPSTITHPITNHAPDGTQGADPFGDPVVQRELQRLLRLHNALDDAQTRKMTWVIPLLWSVVIALISSMACTIIYGVITGMRDNDPFVGAIVICTMIAGGAFGYRWSRHILTRSERTNVDECKRALQDTLTEVTVIYPSVVLAVGSVDRLRERQSIVDALSVMRKKNSPPPIGRSSHALYCSGGSLSFKCRAPAGVYPLALVTGGVYFFVWVYKIHRELAACRGESRTRAPGLALGLMFVPLFNAVWIIALMHGVASQTNAMLKERGLRPAVNAGGLLAMLVVAVIANVISLFQPPFMLLGLPLFWIGTAQLQSALNRAWRAQELI